MVIMAQLPNDLIMDIIKLADGGLSTHKKKFKWSLIIFNEAIKRRQWASPVSRRMREVRVLRHRSGEFWFKKEHYPRDITDIYTNDQHEIMVENNSYKDSIVEIWSTLN